MDCNSLNYIEGDWFFMTPSFSNSLPNGHSIQDIPVKEGSNGILALIGRAAWDDRIIRADRHSSLHRLVYDFTVLTSFFGRFVR
jgi:hypothetical protein